MRTKLLFYILGIAFFFTSKLNGQSNADIYSIYETQYSQLLRTRGVADNEITDLLKIYQSNRLTSDSGFANLLGQLYSNKKDIGILFYFFNNDTLRRAYYKPGKIIDITSIPIKKEKLMEIGANINNALNLYELSNNRKPLAKVAPSALTESFKYTYEDAIINATTILIPKNFDINTKHLLIIPALNIGTIPFHLLKPYKNKSTYLIDNVSFTIIPSLIDLVALRTKILKESCKSWNGMELPQNFDNDEHFSSLKDKSYELKNPLFISNPTYPIDSSFIYPDLPGADQEIDSAIAITKSEYILLRGKYATKDSVLKNLTSSDMVYFATHGVADQVDPMGKSYLVLSGKSPYLTAKEIMAMRNNYVNLPEMVILSACQTGLGKSLEAGTAGLARSFLIGGSNHVIMSLWSVDDNATAYLMSRFMHHLQTPHLFMPSEPLRLAILDTKKIYPKPSQWASFSLFGIDY